MISQLLDKLATLRERLQCQLEYAQSFIPQHVKKDLDILEERVKNCEGDIKERAKFIPSRNRSTIKGDSLQLVFNKGSFSTAKLKKLAVLLGASEEQIEGCRNKFYWSIRKRSSS